VQPIVDENYMHTQSYTEAMRLKLVMLPASCPEFEGHSTHWLMDVAATEPAPCLLTRISVLDPHSVHKCAPTRSLKDPNRHDTHVLVAVSRKKPISQVQTSTLGIPVPGVAVAPATGDSVPHDLQDVLPMESANSPARHAVHVWFPTLDFADPALHCAHSSPVAAWCLVLHSHDITSVLPSFAWVRVGCQS